LTFAETVQIYFRPLKLLGKSGYGLLKISHNVHILVNIKNHKIRFTKRGISSLESIKKIYNIWGLRNDIKF